MPRRDDEIPVYTPEMPYQPKISGKVILAAALVILLFIVSFLSVYTVELGYAAVTVDPFTGDISGPVIGPKIAFKMPWQSVKKVYIATDAVHMWTDVSAVQHGYGSAIGDYPAIESLTKDGLQAWVDLTVRWHIIPSAVPKIVESYPALDYEEKLIIPEIRKITRDVLSKYEAAEVPVARDKISGEIYGALQGVFSGDETTAGGIVVDEVYVRNIKLPDEFLKAIQEKLTSQQRMIAAYYDRNRTIILANASAMAKILEAEGEAKSRIIIANGTASSIDILVRSGADPKEIAPLVIYLEGLKDIARSNATIIVSAGGGTTPILYPIQPKEGGG
ncbi:MAG TPA: prohibitin family protein [Candidatus Korarchaeota archaeon]|nr:prohibitin family protein [Candidatus Korarchaeota archaeon]